MMYIASESPTHSAIYDSLQTIGKDKEYWDMDKVKEGMLEAHREYGVGELEHDDYLDILNGFDLSYRIENDLAMSIRKLIETCGYKNVEFLFHTDNGNTMYFDADFETLGTDYTLKAITDDGLGVSLFEYIHPYGEKTDIKEIERWNDFIHERNFTKEEIHEGVLK